MQLRVQVACDTDHFTLQPEGAPLPSVRNESLQSKRTSPKRRLIRLQIRHRPLLLTQDTCSVVPSGRGASLQMFHALGKILNAKRTNETPAIGGPTLLTLPMRFAHVRARRDESALDLGTSSPE